VTEVVNVLCLDSQQLAKSIRNETTCFCQCVRITQKFLALC